MGLEVCHENIGAIMPISYFVLCIEPLALFILQYVAILECMQHFINRHLLTKKQWAIWTSVGSFCDVS